MFGQYLDQNRFHSWEQNGFTIQNIKWKKFTRHIKVNDLLKVFKNVFIFYIHSDLNTEYGPIVLEVRNGFPIVNIFDRIDIENVLKYPSKFPFRPPTEIVAVYRKSRPDRYASIGITNEYKSSKLFSEIKFINFNYILDKENPGTN